MEVLSATLSDRDWAIIDSLALHRYLTTVQLQRLHFLDHASAEAAGRVSRRVLKRLAEARIIEHLERRVGGVRAGSASFVWRLGPVGERLLSQQAGDGARSRRKEPSTHHLDHCLATAECHVALVEAARVGRLQLLTIQAEPESWRRYLGPGGTPQILKPDLYTVTASGDYEDHWFIEVDRGTESLPTLVSKCRQYEAYRRSGHEQRAGVFPAVIWVLPNAARVAKLSAAVNTASRLERRLFRLTTMAGLLAEIDKGAA